MADQLTDSEAAVLRHYAPLPSDFSNIRQRLGVAGLLSYWSYTDAGRAALAAYDAQKRREIRREAIAEVCADDLAGRPLPDLLEAVLGSIGIGSGPLADCLHERIEAIRDLRAKEEA